MKKSKQKTLTWQEALEIAMPLILKLASQLSRIPSTVVDKDDLINCGLMGLVEAHKRYEDDRETKFSTYAYIRIKGYMLDELRRHQSHKRNLIDKFKKIQKAQHDFRHRKNSNDIGIKNKNRIISKACGLSQKEIDKVSRLVAIKRVDIDVERQTQDFITPENVVALKQRSQKLKKAVSALPDNERKVIDFRFHQELKLRDVGKKLDLSEARVHQLEKSALFKLKEIYQEHDEDFDMSA